MTRKMISAEAAFADWRKGENYREAFDLLEQEFSLASAMIRARASAGLSQAQLARRMRTTTAVVARLESGRTRPSTKMLERFAAATGMRLKISFEPLPSRHAA